MDTITFPYPFNAYACVGDRIQVTYNDVTYTAYLESDTDTGPPDEMQDGYWSSLDPTNPGYIGAKSKRTLQKHIKKEREALEAWKNDQWEYVGIVIHARKGEWERDNVASLWGVEMNHPYDKRGHENEYLDECANDLLNEAIHTVEGKA